MHVTWVPSKVMAKINGWGFLLRFKTLGGLMSLFKHYGLNCKCIDTSSRYSVSNPKHKFTVYMMSRDEYVVIVSNYLPQACNLQT
jgi:hypothetical protein